MKKIIAGTLLSMLIISFTCLTSCKDSSTAKKQQKDELEQFMDIEDQIEENVYPLPTSAQVIKKLTELEVGFIFGLTNPIEYSKKYFSSKRRATNLGVYGADLSYVTLYNKMQEVINYLDAIRGLANELNMSKIYNEDLYDNIRENIDNRDLLVEILTSAFNDTYGYLSENDQQPLALLVVGGAWVEGMYLTTHVSEAAYQNPEFSKVLIEQKESFETFMELAKAYDTDANIAEFLKLLDPVKKVYEGLTTSLTMQNISDITKVITDVRTQIVQ